MRLASLVLNNFRQFAGTQRIDFAQPDDGAGNVTLVHAANGAGKTTILNAFTWVLYGETSEDFEQPERLITDAVWDALSIGEDASCYVELYFEHDGTQYLLRREVAIRKDSHEQYQAGSTVKLSYSDDGGWKAQQAHADVIEQIIPKRLSPFFFFNGERIERIVKREAYEQIQDAIKTLLGLEQYEQALVHLPKVRKVFGDEIRKRGSAKAGALEIRRETLDANIRKQREEIARLEQEKAHQQDEREILAKQLRESAGAAQLQKRRDEQQLALARADEARKEARAKRAETLVVKAYKIWLARQWPEAAKISEGLHERGELPAKLKGQFVEELLERGLCICGTPLRQDEQAYRHVADWRQKAGLAEVESAWQVMEARAAGIEREAGEIGQSLRSYTTQIAEASDAYGVAEALLNQIGKEIEDLGDVNVQGLERRLGEANARLEQLPVDLFKAGQRLNDLTGELEQVKKDLRRAEGDDARSAVLVKTAAAIDEAQIAIKEMLELAKHSVRRRLDAKLRQVHAAISFKEFFPELDKDFELNLWDSEGPQRRPAPKSTGENQVLSLAFIGALVDVCREQADRSGDSSLVGRMGGMYPILMDAAFGNLDDTYRQAIAQALPAMASQVVVLTTKAQASGVVSSTLRPRTGAEYVIALQTSKDDASAESIMLDGKEWEYVVPGAQSDSALLQKVVA